MSTHPINDVNIYPIGTFVSAKDSPTRKLVITAYKKRIYYCDTLDQPKRHLVYFERELKLPS